MTPRTHSVDKVTALVDRSPTRRRILEVIPELELELEGRGPGAGASPVEVLRRLEGEVVGGRAPTLGTVAYHFRVLVKAGALELVRKGTRRGAIEHFYRVTDLGEAGRSRSPLEVAIAALEDLVEVDGLLTAGGLVVATEALEALGRRPRSSVAA